MEKIKGTFSSIREYYKNHKKMKWFSILVGIIIILGLMQFVAHKNEQAKIQAELDKEASEATKIEKQKQMSQLDEEQMRLIEKYGPLDDKPGFIYDSDGTLKAVGDKKMKPEDVAYTYMQGLTKLDFSQVEKYAYPSKVIKTFNNLFDSKGEYSAQTKFKSDVYKNVLKNMQAVEIVDYIKSANNKYVYTFKVKIPDLSYKTFWEKDKDKIFSDLLETTVREKDKDKIKDYLYSYIADYYNGKPVMKTTEAKIILEKTQASGWVVTNDAEVDALAKYPGNDVNNGPLGTILTEFETYYQELEGVKPSYNTNNINKDEEVTGKDVNTEKDDDSISNDMPGEKGSTIRNPFKSKDDD